MAGRVRPPFKIKQKSTMWGMIMRLLVQGIKWGSTVTLGYFFNDVVTWFSKTTGAQVTDPKTGKIRWYWIAIIAVLAGAAVYWLTNQIISFLGKGRRKRAFYMVAVLVASGLAFYLDSLTFLQVAGPGVIMAKLIGTIAGASTGSFTIDYCPEYLTFNIGTVPTSFRVSPTGDGIVMQLDGAGLTNMNGIGQVGAMAANQYYFQIADGYVKKSTTFTITNADAAALNIFGWSDSPASMYVLHLSGFINANAFTEITDFSYLAFPSASANAQFVITWRDGSTDELTRDEVANYLAWSQEVTATRYNIDNRQRRISKVQFSDTAGQNYYYNRYNVPKGVINQVA